MHVSFERREGTVKFIPMTKTKKKFCLKRELGDSSYGIPKRGAIHKH
jgi:hypothetical protein